jgi:hypothetical protein
MSEGPTAAGTARRVGSGTSRLVRAWRTLPHESRLAAFASIGLFLTLFMPWYQVTLIAPAKSAKLQSASASITGWGAFSFVEAAVLLVAAGVLTLLFQRAEGRAFHLPGGDGGVITAAGFWTCALIVWRIFDKQGATTNGPAATSSGVEWGIFIALAAGGFLAYSGSRIRGAHRPEPPLPGEDHAPAGSNAAADTTTEPRRREPRQRDPRQREPLPRRRPARPVPAEPHPGAVPAEPRPRTAPAEARSRAAAEPRPRAAAEPRPRAAGAEPRPRAAAAEPRPRADAPPVAAADATDPTLVRVRRRASADDLFERVVPEDPPTMRFGRIPPSGRPSFRASDAPKPAPAEEQLTIPLRDEETVPLRDDETVRLRDDETVSLGDDATLPLRHDETLPLRHDETLPLGDDATQRLGEDATRPMRRRPER